MYEQFKHQFAVAIAANFPQEDVETILKKLDVVAYNYDVTKKETAVAVYNSELPEMVPERPSLDFCIVTATTMTTAHTRSTARRMYSSTIFSSFQVVYYSKYIVILPHILLNCNTFLKKS